MTAFTAPNAKKMALSPQTILHLDLDAFFCSVEEIRRPELRGRPFAVGGQPGERGVVSSCSYAARRFGVRSAMPMGRAIRLCPGLLVVSGHYRVYSEMSRRVMSMLEQVTPSMDQISIDEAFLDISGLRPSAEFIARRLQAQVRDELGLPCSIGIASNKLVAKIATEVGKKAGPKDSPPFGLTIVPSGQESAFLEPLPLEMLWGVGPKTAIKLTGLGMHTIGDIARWPESSMQGMFGDYGLELLARARGQDERMVISEHEQKSMSQEITFARDVRDDKVLEKTLRQLAAEVAGSLRKASLAGATVRLKIRWPDFTTLTRQTTLLQPTDEENEIAAAALELMRKVRKPGQLVRLIGVGVSGLGAPARQLGLWDAGSDKSRRLTAAIDELRDKYGDKVIHRGEGW